jgi:hypothetical protein
MSTRRIEQNNLRRRNLFCSKFRKRLNLIVVSSLRLEIGAQRRHYSNQIKPLLKIPTLRQSKNCPVDAKIGLAETFPSPKVIV